MSEHAGKMSLCGSYSLLVATCTKGRLIRPEIVVVVKPHSETFLKQFYSDRKTSKKIEKFVSEYADKTSIIFMVRAHFS